ncbi:DUF6783 domain-containing protein [Blautia sp. Sow4_E7]|uniref:DUF6783 domain-containing protein n=1 Tax=Blautia sp. Sow4_E7 TaxID=3438749 RepID=UPI003F9245AB
MRNQWFRFRACLKNHSCNLHAPLCGRFHLNSGIVVWYEKIVNTWTVLVYVIISQTLVLKFISRYILCHLHTQGEEEA